MKLNTGQLLPRRPNEASLDKNNVDKSPGLENNQVQVIQPSSQQQVSPPNDDSQAGQNPHPLQAPQNYRQLDDAVNNDSDKNDEYNNNNYKSDQSLPNEVKSDVRFENQNGNIVPVGPNEAKDGQYNLPLPYEHRNQPSQRNENWEPDVVPAKANDSDAEQPKQVLAPPNEAGNPEGANKGRKEAKNSMSSKGPLMVPILRSQAAGQSAQMDNDNDQNAVGDHFDWLRWLQRLSIENQCS